jgi:hypothetical protein
MYLWWLFESGQAFFQRGNPRFELFDTLNRNTTAGTALLRILPRRQIASISAGSPSAWV